MGFGWCLFHGAKAGSIPVTSTKHFYIFLLKNFLGETKLFIALCKLGVKCTVDYR
jgi:hypothetical protein